MGERYPDTVEVGGSIPPAPTKTILLNGGTRGIRRSKLPTRSDDTARVNDQINVPEVRVIDGEGGQLGIMSIEEALEQSEEAGMDLVEVSPKANPPVCRIMDYGKYKFEQEKKAKEARKKSHQTEVKEVKMRYKIDKHDYDVRIGQATKFLKSGDKVKCTVMFRGREIQHSNLAETLLLKMANDLEEQSEVQQKPKREGRNMIMFLSPRKTPLIKKDDG